MKRQFLTVSWKGYTLRALTSTARPPFTPTRLAFFRGVDPPASLSVIAHSLEMAIDAEGSAIVARPLVQENDTIDVYIDGPLPSTLSTAPNRATVRAVFFRQGTFQHFTLQYRGGGWRCSLAVVNTERAVDDRTRIFPDEARLPKKFFCRDSS